MIQTKRMIFIITLFTSSFSLVQLPFSHFLGRKYIHVEMTSWEFWVKNLALMDSGDKWGPATFSAVSPIRYEDEFHCHITRIRSRDTIRMKTKRKNKKKCENYWHKVDFYFGEGLERGISLWHDEKLTGSSRGWPIDFEDDPPRCRDEKIRVKLKKKQKLESFENCRKKWKIQRFTI